MRYICVQSRADCAEYWVEDEGSGVKGAEGKGKNVMKETAVCTRREALEAYVSVPSETRIAKPDINQFMKALTFAFPIFRNEKGKKEMSPFKHTPTHILFCNIEKTAFLKCFLRFYHQMGTEYQLVFDCLSTFFSVKSHFLFPKIVDTVRKYPGGVN